MSDESPRWTDDQRAHIYRHSLTGVPVSTIADVLGVPAGMISEHLRRTPAQQQLAWLIEQAGGNTADLPGVQFTELALDTAPIPALLAAAAKWGTGPTKACARTLERQATKLRGLLATDQRTAEIRAELYRAEQDLAIARRQTAKVIAAAEERVQTARARVTQAATPTRRAKAQAGAS